MKNKKQILLVVILCCTVAILIYYCWFKMYVRQDSGYQEDRIVEMKNVKTISDIL